MIQLAQRLTRSKPFSGFIVVVILLAGVLAGLETDAGLASRHPSLLGALNLAILAVFVAEIALKLAAHGRRPSEYFRDGWNVFDCLIVALCLLPVAGPFAAVLRLARVLRLLRLVSALPKLQLLVGALLKSLSAMGYVSLLLALLFYIYAVAGVHLFGKADPADFGTLPTSLFTLFRIVTLDNWGDVFNRAIEHVPAVQVAFYFVTFIVFGTMIILNLFIGIIMNSMAEMHEEIADQGRPASAKQAGQPSLARELGEMERQTGVLQKQMRRLQKQLGTGPTTP
jgi:voltage-gated sodium channel